MDDIDTGDDLNKLDSLMDDDSIRPIDFDTPKPAPNPAPDFPDEPAPNPAPPLSEFGEVPPADEALAAGEDLFIPVREALPLPASNAEIEEANLIKKGDYVDLSEKAPGLARMIIGAGWEQKTVDGDKVDMDLSCFLLNRENTTRVDEDFVFYNNETALDGAVKHRGDSRTGAGEGDDETIFVDLNGVPFDIIKVLFVLSIYDEARQGNNFGKVRDIYVRLVNEDDGLELTRFVVPAEEVETANVLKTICLVREGPKWYAECLSLPSYSYLNEVASEYGMIIAEDAG